MDHAELAHQALARGVWEEARVAMLHGAGVRVRDAGPPVESFVMPDLAAFAMTRLEDMHSPIFTAAWAVLVRFGTADPALDRRVRSRVGRESLVAEDLAALAVRDDALLDAYLRLAGEGVDVVGRMLCTRLAGAMVAVGARPETKTRKLFVEVARRSGREGRELRYFLAQLPREP